MQRALLSLVVALAATGLAVADPFAVELVDPLDGSTATLRDGRAHHVAFIATWCPTCIEDLDAIEDLRSRFERAGYELVFVAVTHRQSPERLRRFLEQRTLPGRLLYDASGELQRVLGAEALPAHVLVGADGSIAARAGSVEELAASLRGRRGRGRDGEAP